MGWVFNAPPGWPTPPTGWVPPQGWTPDPSWPPAPAGWQFWLPDGRASPSEPTAIAPSQHLSWRERREEKHAEHQHEEAVAAWRVEQDEADAMAHAAQVAASGGVLIQGLLLKRGEVALWSGPAALIEPRVAPGHYVGGYQGVSLRIAKGVNYRVGGGRGHYVPGPEVQIPVDQGQAFVTSQRVVFTGTRATREWAYAKLVGADASSDERTVLLHVSNRQKVSGLSLGNAGPRFQAHLVLGLAISQDGVDAVAKRYAQAAAEHRGTRP